MFTWASVEAGLEYLSYHSYLCATAEIENGTLGMQHVTDNTRTEHRDR